MSAHDFGFASIGGPSLVKQVDRQRQYDILYRQCCEPVHCSDVLQCAVMALNQKVAKGIISCYVVNALAVGHAAGTVVFTIVNGLCKGPLTDDLRAIKQEKKELLGDALGPSGFES